MRFHRLVLVVVIVATTFASSGCAVARRVSPSGSSTTSAEQAMVNGINDYRNRHGLGDLAVHETLVNKARVWAQYMANGGCGRDGAGVPKICHSTLTSGINVSWTLLEENVGMISPKTNVMGMESAFEKSPSHSENMLNSKITKVGVGVAYWNDYMYVAEEFMAQ
jgi:uncharacterized protein YkwD